MDMERAFSDSLVLSGSEDVEERHVTVKELREQVQQLSSLNGMLAAQLAVTEGELELYKERLAERLRKDPVPRSGSTQEWSWGLGRGSKESSRQSSRQNSKQNSRSTTPQPILENKELGGAPPQGSLEQQGSSAARIDAAALRLALASSNVVVISPSVLSLHKVLGAGSFGQTVLGRFDGILCAVKKVYIDKPEMERQFVREVEALQLLRHPHVLSLWGVVVEPSACWLVTEYMSNGTLNDAIRRGSALKSKPMSTRMQILWDVSTGMAAMERVGVLHRDLKPSNVLLDGNFRAKVADMGLARAVNDDHMMLTPETGTYIYMAPEVMNGSGYGTPADVWSWACMAVEVLSFEFPYQRRLLTPLQIAKEVMQLKMCPDLPEGLDGRMKGLLQQCFSFEPSERPSFRSIAREMEMVIAEQKAQEAGAQGMRGNGSWKAFFSRESATGRLGRVSSSSQLQYDI